MSELERDLRQRLSVLEAERRQLRDMLAPPGFLPPIFQLTANEERGFKALLARDQWTREALLASVYLDTNDCDVPDIKVIDALICKLRKKLEPFSVEIETLWGKGYRISPVMREHAAQLIDAEHDKDLATVAERQE